jgi:23S rRNA (guanosine2251-2'-O)-methyltransferase
MEKRASKFKSKSAVGSRSGTSSRSPTSRDRVSKERGPKKRSERPAPFSSSIARPKRESSRDRGGEFEGRSSPRSYAGSRGATESRGSAGRGKFSRDDRETSYGEKPFRSKFSKEKPFEKRSPSKNSSISSFRSRKPAFRDEGRDFEKKSFHDFAESESSISPNLLFGRKPVEELLRHAPNRIKELHLTESASAYFEKKGMLGSVRVVILQTIALDRLVDGGHHQGVVAKITPQKPKPLSVVLAKVADKKQSILVAFDQVTDPQNLGAMFRLSGAFNVDGVILPERKSAGLSPTVSRISTGASEIVPTAEVTNLASALETCKEAGYWIVGTSLAETTTSVHAYKFPEKVVIVVGSEGEGLRKRTGELCDVNIQIPIPGFIQSLNVSQALGIILYEIGRQTPNIK